MQIRNTMRYPSYQSEGPSSKKSPNKNAGEDVEKREPLYTVGRNVNCAVTMENGKEHRGSLEN